MKRSFAMLFVLTLLSSAVLLPCGSGVLAAPVSSAVTQPGGSAGMPFAGFNAYCLDGTPVDETVFGQADYTVAVVWLDTCIPCIFELPFFQQLSEHYADSQGPSVQVIGMACGATRDRIDQIVENNGYDFPQIFFNSFAVNYYLSDILYHNEQDCIPIPQTFVIDRSGMILMHVWGDFSGYDELYETVSPYFEAVPLTGDADGNGAVDTTDALLVLRCALGIGGDPIGLLDSCDMDNNGNIDTTDALLVLRKALGIL